MADADAGDHPGPSPTGELDVDLVVVGGSAGGIDALQRLLQALPDDLGAAVVVALHRPANRTSALVPVLRRCTGLPLEGAADGAQLRRGEVVVAPPDEHVVVVGAGIHLSRGARINGHRPSIDPLFESAARAFGPRVLGVLLSGALDDGVAGLAAIRAAGGTTAVQAPAEAAFPGMPTAAIDAGVVDHVLPVAGLAGLVVAGARGEGPLAPTGPARRDEVPDDVGVLPVGVAPLSCPNCGGSLVEHEVGGILQFRCRVGHRFTGESLLEVQGDALDDALWAAQRALQERSDLARRMVRRLRRAGLEHRARYHERTAEESDQRAAVIEQALILPPKEEPPGLEGDGDEDGAPGAHVGAG